MGCKKQKKQNGLQRRLACVSQKRPKSINLPIKSPPPLLGTLRKPRPCRIWYPLRISWLSSCCVVSSVSSFSFRSLRPAGLEARLGTHRSLISLLILPFQRTPHGVATPSDSPSRIARIDRILHDRALGVAFFRLSSFLTLLNLRDHALKSLADILVVARARFGKAAA